MSTALEKMQVEVKDRELVFTRMFDAPRQMVWDAFTKVEHLVNWWGPHNFTNKDCTVDLRVGGRMEITMVGMGGEYPCLFIFEEIVPIEKIVWLDKVVEGDFWGPAGPPPSTLMTLLLEDHGSRTKMISISKFDDNAGRDKILAMQAAEGWAQSFERLDALLAAV
ncbi:MAG: SRPBCC domain-containing protein [bacterium]|nr:SRPBCC domain-containing protein [bacterium]